MRIGFVTGEYPPMQGGIGSHCRVLAKTLTQKGHQVFIFSDERAEEPDSNIKLTRKEGKWRGKTLHQVNTWAEVNNLDVVNLHYQTAAYNMSPWIHFATRYIKSSPLITTFHDLRFPYLFPKAGFIRPWIVKHLANTSAGVISTNHEDAEKLKTVPYNSLIPIGSSLDIQLPSDFNRDNTRQKLGIKNEEVLVGYFGFLNHSKGVDTLLESIAKLNQAGHPVKLLMIGGKTGASDESNVAYAQTIEKMISDLAIYHLVQWTGFVDDSEASQYFKAVDFLVLPFRDGASYRRSSLMAAITHECPVITTKPAVDITTFINGENLIMVSPGNIAALTAGIQIMAKDAPLRERVRKGVKELKTVFDWGSIAQQNINFFETVIHAQHRR